MEPNNTNLQVLDSQPAVEQPLDEQDKMLDFTSAQIHFRRIVDEWRSEIGDTEVRRKTRKVEINVEALRQEGKLEEDETIIPVRVIDSNIQREIPAYVNYLKNSRRIAIFRSLENPDQDSDMLEQAFTQGMTYSGWEIPHYKNIDGAATHGWDAVEITYDESKPLNCGIEHIGHEKLIFPKSAIDLQKCPRIIRVYDVTMIQLRQWIKSYGFDQEQVELILSKRRDTRKENETIRIYRAFIKKTNPSTNKSEVYVSWFTLSEGESNWLKAPVLHSLDIKKQMPAPVDPQMQMMALQSGQPMPQPQMIWQDQPLDLYPICILPYRETEESKIVMHKGRVYYDENKQEAQTAILSAFVNGLTRASNVFGAPAAEDGSGSSLKELEDVKLVGGRILSKPMQFWSAPYPDPLVLRSLQYFDQANSEETNQVNFAAMNREDSRKTAKEIGAAQQQQVLLNSVQLTLFSTFLRQVYAFAWLVVQSQALQGKINFLQVPQPQQPVINPMTQQPVVDPQTGQPTMQPVTYANDMATIQQLYDVRAAGDVDVIQKEETIQKMQQDWALIANTPLKDKFLADYIKLKYPEDSDKYLPILEQGNQMNQMQQLIARLGTVLQGTLEQNPHEMASLSQQDKSAISQLMTEAQPYMNTGGGKPQQGGQQ